jgi:hypothetical protein
VTVLEERTHAEPAQMPVQFRQGATYLMVGALGEVGLMVSSALARLYRPRLIFLSRRPLDADCQQRLAKIKDAGAEVVYRSVDITQEDQLAEALVEIKGKVGAIHGVLHFARCVSDGLLLGKSFASFQQTVAAKVEGTLNVDKVTADEPLDFFMLYSSMASLGIQGSADYAYATAFQNAFVRDRNRRVARAERAGKSLAICWGQWVVDIYSNEQRDAAIKQSGFGFIDEASAVPLMEATMREHDEVVGIMAVTDSARVRQIYGLSESQNAPVEMVQKNAVAEAKATLSLTDFIELSRAGDGDFEAAARKILLDQPDDKLAELYDILVD